MTFANIDEDKLPALNVLNEPLQPCCFAPLTGFYRDGMCNTGSMDRGMHTVCVLITREFLEFSKKVGNDLSTPVPEYEFVGLQEGDWWCLCVLRWKEALENGCAPKLRLESCHIATIEHVSLDILKQYQVKEAIR
ncbi:DUF2237 domain-containing protein [Candidatus Marinamargulisbacteria bacterium SCGC AG-343-D04]|nr:DUF2237 domain-containing protein [Candidatus Marinamargulisbacteria bacterium SCGC AG-343-D04]